ncbi:MAG: PEP-CTERM sorting domain-containing protein [Desulfobulbaceae bacterium]|nr:PEP-CTERM sorting domain-containing protein [Desulfobulbaceae bacterium]
MKKTLLAGLAVGVMMFGMVGVASATTIFKISDVSFVKNGYNTGNFTWNIDAAASIADISLSEGQNQSFDFGIFKPNQGRGAADLTEVDSFNVSLIIDPPNATEGDTPNVIANYKSNKSFDKYSVDFGATQTITFGNGGAYELSFCDLTDIGNMGEQNLTANIKLISDSAPVPEPATMLLMGTGLAGLIGARRKKKA